MSDTISRQTAIDALWNALYEYEGETEKQFQESEDLDVGDWIGHRIFVQNMNDIDRQTILNLPSIDAVPVIRCKYCKYNINNARLFDDPDPILTYAWCNTEAFQENDFCSKGKRKEE